MQRYWGVFRPSIRTLAALLVCLLLGSCERWEKSNSKGTYEANLQTVRLGGSLVDSDWSAVGLTLPGLTNSDLPFVTRFSNGGRGSSFAAGGFSGPISFPPGDRVVFNLYTRTPYQPAVEGPIDRITSTMIARTYLTPSASIQLFGGVLLRQGGKFYWSRNFERDRVQLPLATSADPTTITSQLTEGDFVEVGGGTGKPNFSSSGESILFGYFFLFRLNGSVYCGQSCGAGAEVRSWTVDVEGGSQCGSSISLIEKGALLWNQIVNADPPFDPSVFSRFFDEILSRTAAGRRYIDLSAAHSLEVEGIYCANPTEAARALTMRGMWQEPLRSLVDGTGSSVTITASQIESLQAVLNDLKRLGSAELRGAIEVEEAKLQLGPLVGQNMDQLMARQRLTAPSTITLAAAASLHGVPPAFYHSDVRVFNPASAAVSVTARYRCMTGSCGNATQTFVLAPKEMRTFADMPGKFFGALESAGAIEFEGKVTVDSRLYTPAAGAPTTGMYVPAVTASEAFSESVLTSLAHSVNGSVGFRTNVGAYNPNDVALDVYFTVYDAKGTRLGEVVRRTAARTPVQVNNIFSVIGVTMDFSGAYCVVRAEGANELFSYASVIDNQSQDLIFVAGRNRRLNTAATTLPASASLHGVPPTFFHSDVVVFNPSETTAANVTARYRCFAPPCGKATAFFVVPARGSLLFEDAAVALFEAPESGGAMEFKGDVLVDSRLYTPSRPAPTTGMYVPGLPFSQAYAEALLMSLSHSASGATGFRTNAGVYNPNLALNVTFTLYAPDGTSLATVTRAVAAESPVQVNNIFAAAGVATDVPNAYCIVRADGGQKLFAYASVIDNQSQDLIFVRGVDGRVPPP